MYPSTLGSQQGAAMIVSLMLLVAITLLGVFVMSGSHLEWLMASNSRFQTDAEMRAEAALLEGENALKNPLFNPTSFTWTNSDAYYNHSTDPVPDPRNIANWTSPAAFNTINATTLPPAEYLIEYMGCVVISGGGGCQAPDTVSINTYHIWAYAADSKGASRIVQSTLIDTVPVPLTYRMGDPLTHTYTRAFAQIDHDQPPNP